MIKLNQKQIVPTIFPDNTSQVWKLQDGMVAEDKNIIEWEFEREAELMHISQLNYLIKELEPAAKLVLAIDYLPYARQDKPVSNNATFALRVFADWINQLDFDLVTVFDAHNFSVTEELIHKCVILRAESLIQPIIDANGYTPVFPDLGAQKRYDVSSFRKPLVFDKTRVQETGEITGLKLIEGKVEAISYLIVDDICDGGRTFIDVARKMTELGAGDIHLYISHGIFSRSLLPLREAGIQRIFTRKGEEK